MQTLEAAGCDAGTPDTEIELRPQSALLCVRAFNAGAELGVLCSSAAPAVDTARCLEPRDRGNEMRTGQPERRWKRLPLVVECTLLGDGGTTERTPDDYTTESARGTA